MNKTLENCCSNPKWIKVKGSMNRFKCTNCELIQ